MNAEHLLTHFDRIADAPAAIPRLRRFILDLAVRGKLVEQDPNGEPTAELLRRIAAEKERLVKAGEIKKQKATPALNETELPFALPVHWRWSQIAEIGLLSPRNEAADDTLASFVPMPMIAAGYGEASNHEVRRWGDIKKGYTHFAEGDVGLAKITPCFQNGKSAVFRDLTGELGSGTTELHIVRPLFVNPNFLLLFLKCPHFIETGIPRMTGTAGQKRVPTEYFAHSPFPLPPLAEQHRIVAKVDELMALCDRLEAVRKEREATRDRLTAASLARLNTPDPGPAVFQNHAAFALNNLTSLTTRPAQIKAFRQTILNLAVRGNLVEQDSNDEPAAELLKRIAAERERLAKLEEIRKPKVPASMDESLFDIPPSWEWRALREIAHFENGDRSKNYPSGSDIKTKGVPFFSTKNVSDYAVKFDQLDFITQEKFQSLRSGKMKDLDILITLRGSVGKLGLFQATEQFTTGFINAQLVIIRNFERNLVRFCLTFMKSHTFLNQILARSSGSATPQLSASQLSEVLIPIPPLAEQHRIVAKVDELMALCDRLEASLAAGDEMRGRLLEALLHRAISVGVAPDDGSDNSGLDNGIQTRELEMS